MPYSVETWLNDRQAVSYSPQHTVTVVLTSGMELHGMVVQRTAEFIDLVLEDDEWARVPRQGIAAIITDKPLGV